MARGRGLSAIKRTEALETGAVTHVGKPCVCGHSGVRYSRNSNCVTCQTEKARRARAIKPPGHDAEYMRSWRLKNPQAAYAATKRWKSNHPEQARLAARLHWHIRRARKVSAPGSHTTEQALEVLAAQDFRCAYCGSRDRLTRDHKIPLSRGGSNAIENTQWLCVSDNSKKKDRTDSEYRMLKGLSTLAPLDGATWPVKT